MPHEQDLELDAAPGRKHGLPVLRLSSLTQVTTKTLISPDKTMSRAAGSGPTVRAEVRAQVRVRPSRWRGLQRGPLVCQSVIRVQNDFYAITT